MKKTFALIGAAGYIAPRHLKAIQSVGGELVAAVDPNDSVGILDSYFPGAAFFTEFERFDRHLEKLKRRGEAVDYIIVCSPNYLHDAHCRFGLRYGADVICEKPIALNPWNLDGLAEIEKETGKRVFNILQLRLHEDILKLKAQVEKSDPDKKYDIDLTYITSRGNWYYASWKSDFEKSGGVATNIGIHFFDMLQWIFGRCVENKVYQHRHDRAGGFLALERANVNWFLSINYDTLPEAIKEKGQRTYRNISVDGAELEFSNGFTELHNRSYAAILSGDGFILETTKPALEMAYDIRNAKLEEAPEDAHPFLQKTLTPHPFNRRKV